MGNTLSTLYTAPPYLSGYAPVAQQLPWAPGSWGSPPALVQAAADRKTRVARVLTWVNETRRLFSIGDPIADFSRAKLQCEKKCVLAAALCGDGVTAEVGTHKFRFVQHPTKVLVNYGGKEWKTDPTEVTFAQPDYVTDFIRDFDANKYPEYVDRRAS